MMLLALFSFLKISWDIWGILWFHKHFWSVISISVKNGIIILIGIVLNL